MRRRRKTGRWFTIRVRGLLAQDTLLAAQFRQPSDETPKEES
jgi:hypothetical protein